MSKKFLLSQSATTKVAIGLATIGGIGAVGHHVINQAIDSQAEAKEQSNNKDVTGLNSFSEVLLPKKVSSILDSPIGPVNSNIFESDKKVDLSSLNLENSTRVEDETIPFETLFNYWKNSPGHYANMISDNYKYFSFAASVGRASANMDEYSELYPVIMGVQVFQ